MLKATFLLLLQQCIITIFFNYFAMFAFHTEMHFTAENISILPSCLPFIPFVIFSSSVFFFNSPLRFPLSFSLSFLIFISSFISFGHPLLFTSFFSLPRFSPGLLISPSLTLKSGLQVTPMPFATPFSSV